MAVIPRIPVQHWGKESRNLALGTNVSQILHRSNWDKSDSYQPGCPLHLSGWYSRGSRGLLCAPGGSSIFFVLRKDPVPQLAHLIAKPAVDEDIYTVSLVLVNCLHGRAGESTKTVPNNDCPPLVSSRQTFMVTHSMLSLDACSLWLHALSGYMLSLVIMKTRPLSGVKEELHSLTLVLVVSFWLCLLR